MKTFEFGEIVWHVSVEYLQVDLQKLIVAFTYVSKQTSLLYNPETNTYVSHSHHKLHKNRKDALSSLDEEIQKQTKKCLAELAKIQNSYTRALKVI